MKTANKQRSQPWVGLATCFIINLRTQRFLVYAGRE